MGHSKSRALVDVLGLTSFRLFKDRNMAVFFVFAMLLGAALQLTNAYGDTFLHDFANVPAFQDAIAVKYPAIIMSISQISETLRSEEHTSELQSLMRNSYAVFCLKKKNKQHTLKYNT